LFLETIARRMPRVRGDYRRVVTDQNYERVLADFLVERAQLAAALPRRDRDDLSSTMGAAGLAADLLPIIIHLLNRLRHRPKPWAAMRFLVSATRSSTSHTRCGSFLILLCRVLAVSMLVLFLARPLAGGWLGWALSPRRTPYSFCWTARPAWKRAGGVTKREQALKLAFPGGPAIRGNQPSRSN
jgi:hypothetical protein